MGFLRWNLFQMKMAGETIKMTVKALECYMDLVDKGVARFESIWHLFLKEVLP